MNIQHPELQKYLKALNKGRHFFIILFLGIMSVVVWGSYFLPKRYEAKSTIFIESNVIGELVKGIAITPSMDDRIRVLRYAMLSRNLVSKTLTDLNVDAKDEKIFEQKIMAYQQHTQISVKGNDLFTVSLRDPDPKFAMDYVNTLVRRYVEENISAKREEAFGADRFVAEQVAQFKEKLDQADEKIIKYRQDKGIYMAFDETSTIKEIKELKNEIDNINVMKNQLMATKRITEMQLKNEQPMTVAFARHAGNDATITAIENKISQLLVKYTENYPEVIRLKAEIEALKKQAETKPQGTPPEDKTEPEMSTMNPIYQQLKQTLFQTEAEIDALDAKKIQLSALIARKEAELRSIPEGKKILADLEKERDSYRKIYEQLLARVGQAKVSKDMEIEDKATTFRIVDPAVLPRKPVSPNRVKLILFGIFLGLIGGVGGIVVRENFSPSVNSLKMIKNLGVDVLAVIPRIFNQEEQQAEKKKNRLVYSIAGSYLCVIGLLLIHELLGLTYVDRFFALFRL